MAAFLRHKTFDNEVADFEETYFDYQLRLLFKDRYQFTADCALITLKIKLEQSKPKQLHLLDSQLQLIALVSSYWTDEQYRVVHLISTYFEKIALKEYLIHEIELLTVSQHLISADCYTYSDNILVSKSVIVCERQVHA